jgi:predicted nucleic acid-binding protein
VIGYFDTSAVVPLVVAEPSSSRCAELWRTCDTRTSSILVLVEAHAALAQGLRGGRLTRGQHAAAVRLLERRINELALVSVSRAIARAAATLALTQRLRGYDAVHAATAQALTDLTLVAITADQSMLRALGALGVSVIDPNVDFNSAPGGPENSDS